MTKNFGAESEGQRRDWASIVTVLCAVVVTFLVGARQVRAWLAPPAPVPGQAAMKPVYVSDWRTLLSIGERIGPAEAPVVITEFGDLQCPICGSFKRSVDAATQKFGDSVAVVFIHFPLTAIHHNAGPAAQAAECAASQGKFSQFYDLAYSKQDSLGKKSWHDYARDAGVADLTSFDKCTADTVPMSRIRLGQAAGKKLKIHGTPTVLLNGWEYAGALPPARLDSAIRAILNGKTPPDFTRKG